MLCIMAEYLSIVLGDVLRQLVGLPCIVSAVSFFIDIVDLLSRYLHRAGIFVYVVNKVVLDSDIVIVPALDPQLFVNGTLECLVAEPFGLSFKLIAPVLNGSKYLLHIRLRVV